MYWNALSQKLSDYYAIASTRKFMIALFGWVAAGAATLVGVALLILWSASVGVTDYISIPAGTTELQIGSADGVIMIGVFDRTIRPRWGRGNSVTLFSVHPDSDNNVAGFAAAGNLSGWAVAVPHLIVVAFVMIVPAWWVLVVRSRHVIEHRRENGLCHACGYDVRESRDVCPECGDPIRRGRPRYGEKRPVAA
jgi:hypothetical protein